MMRSMKLIAALGLAAALLSAPAIAAGGKKFAPDVDFSFDGPFGTFDRAQLQRGFQVYKEVCSACHSMNLMSYRNLGQPGGPEFPEEQVKAIAAQYQVQDGPDADGNMFERPALPSDRFARPFPNEEAAKAANGGAYPPDLSLITRARNGWEGNLPTLYLTRLFFGGGGPEYVHAVLTGYQDPPADKAAEAPDGKLYNPYFEHGPWIGMPNILSDGGVEYSDGTAATVDQQARDVAAFLAWAGEPKMEERKRIGFQVIAYLAVLALLLYLVTRKLWARLPH
jgi:ubiquinol-cytochrome c reductase cytochrome c1 subunit